MTGLAAADISKRLMRFIGAEFGWSDMISRRSQKVLIQGVWLAFGAHLMFLALFYHLQAFALVRFNFVSLAIYLICIYLSSNGKNMLIVTLLFVLEVVAHAIIAIHSFGWDSGFHYYLLIFVPFVFANENGSLSFKLFVSASLCSGYLMLHISSVDSVPAVELPEQMTRLMLYGNIVGVFAAVGFLANLHRLQVLEVEAELKKMASTDPLTGLFNRRRLLEAAELELSRRARNHSALSLAVLDIDNFKQINDVYGHDLGDSVLKQVAEVLHLSVRKQDLVARWGGEEFLLMLPETGQAGAVKIADSIRCQVATIPINVGSEIVNITISTGVSEFGQHENFDQCFARADSALYKAKKTGKNKVVKA